MQTRLSVVLTRPASSGAKARVMRISFSGELAYEVNVPANAGRAVWEALMAAGAEFDITPYGTETMHVLRAEKGYIIVGQDTDGSITPFDLGMGGVVAKSKDFLGKEALMKQKAGGVRQRLVCLVLDEAEPNLWGGEPIFWDGEPAGYTTSAAWSPTIGRSIALGYVKRPDKRVLPPSATKEGTFEIGLFDKRHTARAVTRAV